MTRLRKCKNSSKNLMTKNKKIIKRISIDVKKLIAHQKKSSVD